MTTASAILHLVADHAVTNIPDRFFGNFVEHLGRCVYGGIYEPVHPNADATDCNRVAETAFPIGCY